MGLIWSRNSEAETSSRSGVLYFGTHFTLAGEQHETNAPETFLFGSMTDLAMLVRGEAGESPETPPSYVKHTCTLSCPVNIHKETVKLVPVEGSTTKYTLEFEFDSSQDCDVNIFLQASESRDSFKNFTCLSPSPELRSPAQRFSCGSGLCYQSGSFLVDFGQHEALKPLSEDSPEYPMIILLQGALETSSGMISSQATFFSFEMSPEGKYSPKLLKQYVTINGLSYTIHEIYGIEQKKAIAPEQEQDIDKDEDEYTVECVVCMVDAKDTLVLPCRHLCLCSSCAEVLRFQSHKCPICRAPFHSLLQIRVAKLDHEEASAADADKISSTQASNCTLIKVSPDEASKKTESDAPDHIFAAGDTFTETPAEIQEASCAPSTNSVSPRPETNAAHSCVVEMSDQEKRVLGTVSIVEAYRTSCSTAAPDMIPLKPL
eukprot:Sdes_comp16119_c0_seq1m5348